MGFLKEPYWVHSYIIFVLMIYSFWKLIKCDFNLFKTWFDGNILTINFDKTNYITFTTNKFSAPTLRVIQSNVVKNQNVNVNKYNCQQTL